MDKDLEKRRSWPWRKKNATNVSEGGTSPTRVKVVEDHQIPSDQVATSDEEVFDAVDDKVSAMEKSLRQELATLHERLLAALAEINIQENLVKKHVKVAEEAVAGWERADNEAGDLKSQLDMAIQQRLATEDRVKHLDGALNEVMKQVRNGREEQAQCIHEAIVKKTREFDKLRAEMESKMADVTQLLAQSQRELVESRAESKALTLALEDRSQELAEVKEEKMIAESDIKALQVQLERMEKEHVNLKYQNHIVSKELDARSSEVVNGRRASELVTQQLANSAKKVTKLEEECNKLRTMVQKRPPSPAPTARMKLEMDALGKKEPGVSKPRQRLMVKSPRREDHPPQRITPKNVPDSKVSREADLLEERVEYLDQETQMLKEELAKRNDELQAARLMCVKTASKLSSVEEELQALKSAAPTSSSEGNSSHVPAAASPVTNPDLSRRSSVSKKDSLNFELMDDFIEMERLANCESQSQSQSVTSSEHVLWTDSGKGADTPQHQVQHQIAGLEDALALKDRDLEAANHMCHELSSKLAVAEDQLSTLQCRNAANEKLVINLQERLDHFLESPKADPNSHKMMGPVQPELAMAVRKVVHICESLAQATGSEFFPSAASSGQSEISISPRSIAMSIHWQDLELESSMGSLVQAANKFLQSETNIIDFVLELAFTLDCIMTVCRTEFQALRKESDTARSERQAVSMIAESAKTLVSDLEMELSTIRTEQAALESRMQVELDRFSRLEEVEMSRFPDLETEISQLRTDKADLEHRLAEMEDSLSQANERVEALRVQLNDAELLIGELKAQENGYDNEKKEDEMIEEELLELSSSHPGLAMSLRASDAEMNQLHDKVAALEVELHGERLRHHDVLAKLEDLQQQIHRGVGRSEHSSGLSPPKKVERLQLVSGGDDAIKIARKEKDIAAAALAECQRTILALGRQLKVLGVEESSTGATNPSDSIEKMTQSLEFLRSQAESTDGGGGGGGMQLTSPTTGTNLTWSGARPTRSILPGLFYRQNLASGNKNIESTENGSLLNSPAQSDQSFQDTTSAPGSPATVLRSVRTIRPAPLSKAGLVSNGHNNNNNNNNNNNSSSTNGDNYATPDLPSASSTAKRVYSRSQSELSISSGNST